MSADPAGTVDGTNLFAYVRGSPVVFHDPNGTDRTTELQSEISYLRQTITSGSVSESEAGDLSLRLQDREIELSNLQEAQHKKDLVAELGAQLPSADEAQFDEKALIQTVREGSQAIDIQRGQELFAKQKAAEAARISPGEANAEIQGFGEETGTPGRLLIEGLAIDRGLGLLARLGGAAQKALKPLTEGVEFEGVTSGALGLEQLAHTRIGNTVALDANSVRGLAELRASGALGSTDNLIVTHNVARELFRQAGTRTSDLTNAGIRVVGGSPTGATVPASKVAGILRGLPRGAKSAANDGLNLVEAAAAGASKFVTRDKAILRGFGQKSTSIPGTGGLSIKAVTF